MITNLKRLRLEKGVTQKTLAGVLGVSQQSVNKYENHNVEPDLTILMKMADYFGTSVDLLIGHVDEESDPPALHTIDENEASLLRSFRMLSDKQKQVVLSLADSYR